MRNAFLAGRLFLSPNLTAHGARKTDIVFPKRKPCRFMRLPVTAFQLCRSRKAQSSLCLVLPRSSMILPEYDVVMSMYSVGYVLVPQLIAEN